MPAARQARGPSAVARQARVQSPADKVIDLSGGLGGLISGSRFDPDPHSKISTLSNQ